MPITIELTAIATPKKRGLRPYGPDNPPPVKQRGQIAKITKSLKLGILDGAAAWGADGEGEGGLHGYLTMAAGKYPKQYLQLIGKVLPMTGGMGDDTVRPTVSLNITSIESGSYLSTEDIARLKGDTIEQEALPVARIEPPVIEPPPAEVQPTELEAKLLAMDHDQLLQLAESLNVGR